MQAAPGWYPDPGSPHVTRYWDGDRYTHERHWNGSAWVEPPPVAPPAAPIAPVATTPVEPAPASVPAAVVRAPVEDAPVATAPTPAAPFATPPAFTSVAPGAANAVAPRVKPPLLFWLLIGGCAGVALAAFLPWYSVSAFGVSASSGPRDGGPVLLLILAAGIAALGWPTMTATPLSMARKIGLLPIVGFLALAVVTNWSDLSDLKDQSTGRVFGVTVNTGISVDAGFGLLLYTASVILLVVLVVRIWLSGRKDATARV